MSDHIPLNRMELEQFRLKANILALKAMLRTLSGLFAASSPAHAQAMQDAFGRMRDTSARLVLTELDPASSDMIASEYQAIVDDLLRFIENGLAAAGDGAGPEAAPASSAMACAAA
jgi:hypothetical protein